MAFHPKNLFLFMAVIAVLMLGASARAGTLSPALAGFGFVGIVAIEAALFFGLFAGRRRTP